MLPDSLQSLLFALEQEFSAVVDRLRRLLERLTERLKMVWRSIRYPTPDWDSVPRPEPLESIRESISPRASVSVSGLPYSVSVTNLVLQYRALSPLGFDENTTGTFTG